jgi:beta-galactosidase
VGEAAGDFFARKDFVRMVQVDNEASMFFRDGPFDQDYRPEAVALYRAWLEEQGLEPRDPPASVEEGKEGLRHGLLWLRFRNHLVCRALERMKDMLKDAGMGSAPFSHNLPPSGMLSSVALRDVKAAVDRVTTDLYATARDCRTAMDQVLLLSSVEKEPFAGEMGSGTVFYTPYVTEFDNKFVALSSLACGLRGFNVYMGTARDRWLGGLVTEAGTVERTSLLHFYQRLLMLMDGLGMDAFRPLHGAAVLLPRVYLDHSTLLFPIPAVSPILVQGFGMNLKTFLPRAGGDGPAGASVHVRWLERLDMIMEALRKAALFYALAESPGPPDMAGDGLRPVLLVPTFDYIDSDTVRAVIGHAEGGGRVLAGPEKPRLDERMQPLDPGLAMRLDALAGEGRILFSGGLESGGAWTRELESARAAVEETTPVKLRKKHPLCEFIDGCSSWSIDTRASQP